MRDSPVNCKRYWFKKPGTRSRWLTYLSNLGAQVRGSEGSLAGVVQYITISSVWTHFLLYGIYLKVRTCVLLHSVFYTLAQGNPLEAVLLSRGKDGWGGCVYLNFDDVRIVLHRISPFLHQVRCWQLSVCQGSDILTRSSSYKDHQVFHHAVCLVSVWNGYGALACQGIHFHTLKFAATHLTTWWL